MRIRSIAPVFHVSDIDASIAFYVDTLGFEEDFRIDTYAGVKMDGLSVHLSQTDGQARPVGGGTLYVFCDDVDSYFRNQVSGKNVKILQPPADQGYGMRDFVLHDPDGNQISFGRDTED